MLRCLALSFLALSLLAGPAAARGDGPSGGRRTEAKGASVQAERQGLLRRAVFTRPVASRLAEGTRRGAVAVKVAASRRWAHGLPPALGVQAQECPAGTMATLAEGHDDIVRCMPM